MNEFLRASNRIGRAALLAVSWVGITGILGLASWKDDHSFQRIATWVLLWYFTVLFPTFLSLRVRRVLRTLSRAHPDAALSVERDLTYVSLAVLIAGAAAVLAAFALAIGR